MLQENRKTDWDNYYNKTYKIRSFTRKQTERLLLKLMKKYSLNLDNKSIVELGGANSCFYDAIRNQINPLNFHVIDNNETGLNKFKMRTAEDKKVSMQNADILNINTEQKFDLAFSIGLIEHFDIDNTAKSIKTHFDLVKSGDIVIISFPTPTLIYRVARKICEIIGIWFFHDERPIKYSEAKPEFIKHGEILFTKINWLAILSQRFIVTKKY